ncbi:plant Tudor-like RNA-binding protein [Striga asiatica]|uniref:Plant Tudor-like RNA-binding protein n=1 Tax=Striga asiatica TaxID=4170 RepID=A0A5A7PJK6_STRAF|nr:plant Tudor-like RNA-binding protein [Striga asiatica]
MRFKIGDKVEVLNNKEWPISWRAGKVLSISGHKHLVQYDSNPDSPRSQIMEMVSSKFMRPQPPLVEGAESYAAGDIVEVFYQDSWKLGVVLDTLGCQSEIKRNRKIRQMQFLVRIFGCSRDLAIDSSDIRTRQTWLGEKWILMGKGSQLGDNIITSRPLTSSNYFRSNRLKRHLSTVQGNTSLLFEAQNGPPQKFKKIEKEGQKYQANVISNEFTERRKNHVLGFSSFKGSDLNTSDIDACSVGSCSIVSNSFKNSYSHFLSTNGQEAETLISDAESFYGSGSGRKIFLSHPPDEDFEVSVRELELHAYRSTLRALHASGPLSWEQEAMLTNLRIMLRISNDEHLNELKHLISTDMAVSVR